jgi:hypothetical protein
MGFFKQTWMKILIVVILVLVVGTTAAYLLETQQNPPNAFSQATSSSQAPIGNRFSPTIVQPSLTALPSQGQTVATANWSTYTNKELGFSIQYPSDLDAIAICV